MKKLFLTAMAFAALMSAPVLTSCSDEDTPGGGGGGQGESVEIGGGTLEEDMTLDATKEYLLTGTLTVPDGVTLTIPAGTTIRAQKGFDKYIIVAQGGKIEARGTATQPIVFTADDESAAASGYWGGLIINGKAPISGGGTSAAEVDNDQMYGGTDEADNSGTIQYVKLLYTGARSSADVEHNGLTLNGVGNGTTIDHIYILEGADDAIEFFGGSVNVDNLLAVNCDDDMFDFTQGYSGKLSNCYGVWEEGFTSSEEDPRGVEADGNLDGNHSEHTPQSDFTIENMTIDNLSAQEMNDAIKIRRGAKATITNALVKGSGPIDDLVDMTDSKGVADNASVISVTTENAATDVEMVYVPDSEKDPNGKVQTCTATVNVASGNVGASQSAFAWTGYSFGGGAASVVVETLPTDISADLELDASKEYLIEGSVIVADGATLTIPAGTTIRAKEGFANYLLVAQGGKIMAEGTAEKPITFTAENEAEAAAGYWGGLIINGKAPLSGAGAGTIGRTEINNDFEYGGTDIADNSGVLKYVRILYTGARSSEDIEHNGLTLNGVGNGTLIENIYVAEGADDAIEFFGGSVNVTGLLAVNSDDDMFDFTQGYCGTLKDCYGRWEEGFTSTESDPSGVEADGNLDGNGPDHTPQSDFKIENMTIENLSGQEMTAAINVRRHAKATVTNALIKGSGPIYNLINLDGGTKGTADNASSLSVTNEATDVTTEENKGTCTATVNFVSGNTGCELDFAWTGYSL